MANPFAEADGKKHPRLIPEIEKSSRLQALAETLPGRALLTFLFLSVLFSFGRESFFAPRGWMQIAAILFVGIAPLRPLAKILTAALLFYFDGLPRNFGSAVGQSGQSRLVHEAYINFIYQMGAWAPLHYAAALLLAGLLAYGCQRVLRRMRSRLPAIWLFFVWAAVIAGASATPRTSAVFPLVWVAAGTFSLCLFSLGFFHVSQTPLVLAKWAAFSLQTLLIQPPFTVIRHPALLDSKTTPSPAVCRLKALKLIVWARILAAMNTGLKILVFEKLGWDNFNALGLAEYNAHHLVWYEVFGTRFAQTLSLLLYISVTTGIGISLIRLAGVYLPRALCRPYLARSFNGYYRRCLFYYSELILHLFFYPLYEKIYFLVSSKTWRVQIALFLSLLGGGWIFHVVITWQNFFFFGAASAAANALGWIPYFAAVAICCGISEAGWIHRRLAGAPLAVHCLLNLSVHSLLMTFMQYSVGESLSDRVDFIRSMLPL
jgi:hypothetical protein